MVTEEGAGLGMHVTVNKVMVFFARGGGVGLRFSSPVF